MNVRAFGAVVIVCGLGLGVLALRGGEKGRGTAVSDDLPAGLFLTSEPAGVQDITPVKLDAKAGDKVVLRGRIGGSKSPFVENRAVLLLMDVNVPNCHENHNPGCPTPWDFCCAPREDKLAGSATVQVVGKDGSPLRAPLEGVKSLKPLAEVVVVGEVVRRGEAGDLVVDATGFYVTGK